MFDCYWPAFTCRGTDLLSGRYTISGSCWSFADAVRSGLHTILRLHGLHPFHPLIPHFSLHSSRFNWLYCNHVLLVLHYARYFSCHSLKRKWQPSQAGISYRWTARWNNKRWYGFLCGLLRWISVSGGNVVNLSPKALIFQGYRALFFVKISVFFWKDLTKASKSEVVAATNLITLRRYVLWIEPTYAKYHSIHKGVYHKPWQTGSSSENEVCTSEFNNSLIAIINKTGWVNNHNTAIAIQKSYKYTDCSYSWIIPITSGNDWTNNKY